MPIDITTNDLSVRVSLSEELTIYSVIEFRDALISHLKPSVDISVNLSQVTEVDTAGLQWLLALKALSMAQSVEFCHHSKAIVDALELSGLSGTFDDTIVLASEARS
ncbi:STAS domain-containing protein [Shewanella decolorationis]|uniref:STAS domain-containing protein n=1 Tax=Shewanella decolorationis TaxID=256839 RepID=A0A5B8QYA9_9GAMM|nr:STAS domain-containing protein [Shewanella decolorationis]QDZ90881.1 STAS domain-containing protein [Shewanella decolorationis]